MRACWRPPTFEGKYCIAVVLPYIISYIVYVYQVVKTHFLYYPPFRYANTRNRIGRFVFEAIEVVHES
jgi:hypothetical protein